jgi:hypothetical protein
MQSIAACVLSGVCLIVGQAIAQQTVVDLRDFRTQEVKSVGITLDKETTLHINALGGGDDRSSWGSWWGGFFNRDDDRDMMFAAGWIIDANTREPVWEMTMENTRGRDYRRTFDDDVRLQRGSYEVYYAAYGFARYHGRSGFSVNIDRRPGRDHGKRGSYTVSFGRDDRDEYEEFMDNAKDYGITLEAESASDASAIQKFDPPMAFRNAIFTVQRVGDDAFIRKTLTVSREVPIHIYAIGEGRWRDGMYDYGWITRADSRERVWEMRVGNTDNAGGSVKNRKFDGDVKLAPGTYELVFITDDSHSNDDWNLAPPVDVYNHGITLLTSNESDRAAISVKDPPPVIKNAFVTLTHPGDNDYKSEGFTLKNDAKIRVYAFGEADNDNDAADYGWIANAKTRERVWDMSREHTEHGGGAQKNRFVDEIISLPKGSYIAYYVTDGSHSYNDWNADPPFDPENYGLTLMGVGFDANSIKTFDEGAESDVLAQIIRVSDYKRLSKRFTLDRQTHVRVYALGEGMGREMYDYGWIENTGNGRTVWEMTYGMTTRAGGAKKNRLVNSTIVLDKGEYELHYETDGSHSFNDWNADPPEDRTHWGITLYKEH